MPKVLPNAAAVQALADLLSGGTLKDEGWTYKAPVMPSDGIARITPKRAMETRQIHEANFAELVRQNRLDTLREDALAAKAAMRCNSLEVKSAKPF